jgi:L-lactate dehydrogenase (cytochrome)
LDAAIRQREGVKILVTNIRDLHLLAKQRLPKSVYVYVANGGYEEETLVRNRRDLESFALVPRVLNDVSNRSTAVEMAGFPASMPVALAPVGACGLTYPNGEVEAAKAAKAKGLPFCLSTLSIATVEDVADGIHSPFWFQLYLMKDKNLN